MATLDVDRILGVSPNEALQGMEFVAFDVETTGLSAIACKLVELSAVRFNGRGETISEFSHLINPETDIPEEVSAIHGITSDMVMNEPPARVILPQFLEFLGGQAVLLAHNASFDIGFLRVGLKRLGLDVPAHPVIDTLTLARSVVFDVHNFQLKTLAEFFGVMANDYHRALADSHHVREIFGRMLGENPGIATWGDLVDLNCVQLLSPDESEEEVPAELSEFTITIRQAIKDGKRVRMVYSGTGRYKSSRVVQPLAVLENRGYYYLSGICQQAEAERTYRIDRIKSLTILT